jgi:protein-S-isoprenylcysteine O-methyltransferase Ste14
MLWRSLPLAGMAAIVVITVCVRPWVQHRRYGTSGLVLFRSGKLSQDLRDAALVVVIALLTAQAAVAAAGRREPLLLVVGPGAIGDLLQVAGAVMMAAGIALLASGQLNMGASWRVGIKEGEAPGLVTGGLYRFCRHPIYLGLLTAVAGYTALLPTAVSLLLLATTYTRVRIQAAAEEAYLERTYGATYRDYARRVGRFLPGIGRRNGLNG